MVKYGQSASYAPHYDYLDVSPKNMLFGNRLATAFFVVKPARRGGATLFPNLGLAIKPSAGDLLLWMNVDSNDRREDDSYHAGCPIERGEKVAVTLWVRSRYQDFMQCSLVHEGYEPEQLVRK